MGLSGEWQTDGCDTDHPGLLIEFCLTCGMLFRRELTDRLCYTPLHQQKLSDHGLIPACWPTLRTQTMPFTAAQLAAHDAAQAAQAHQYDISRNLPRAGNGPAAASSSRKANRRRSATPKIAEVQNKLDHDLEVRARKETSDSEFLKKFKWDEDEAAEPEEPEEEPPLNIEELSNRDLKALIESAGIDHRDCVEKSELRVRAAEALRVLAGEDQVSAADQAESAAEREPMSEPQPHSHSQPEVATARTAWTDTSPAPPSADPQPEQQHPTAARGEARPPVEIPRLRLSAARRSSESATPLPPERLSSATTASGDVAPCDLEELSPCKMEELRASGVARMEATACKCDGGVAPCNETDAGLKKSARGADSGYVQLVVDELSQWTNLRERMRTLSQMMGFSGQAVGQAFSAEI